MRGVINWFGRLTRAVGRSHRPTRQAFVVERLEPRQMLAADCFFIVEIGPSDVETSEQYAASSYADTWQPESVRYESARYDVAPNDAESAGDSVLGQVDEYYLIYLDDVLDEIGELFEVQETTFGDFDDLNFAWFS
ncbi:MAG: hypothetical protein KJ000_09585 [Pirellulaceae bacterium]|jgi:hypothetical protein|nr:hypothetical protein [Pirellulaceae bacterium]